MKWGERVIFDGDLVGETQSTLSDPCRFRRFEPVSIRIAWASLRLEGEIILGLSTIPYRQYTTILERSIGPSVSSF